MRGAQALSVSFIVRFHRTCVESAIASKSVVCIPGRSIYRILLGGWLALSALGRTDTLRAFMTSCAMNASTANSSAICTKRALSWKAGASNITSVVRTVRLATPSEYAGRRTDRFDGAARPQTPRRSPRQAFGGN